MQQIDRKVIIRPFDQSREGCCMRLPTRVSICLIVTACLASSGIAQSSTARVGVGLLPATQGVTQQEGQDLLVTSLSSDKHWVATIELARLDASLLPRALVEARDKGCEFAVLPTMATYQGPIPRTPEGPGPRNFSMFRVKILYKLYRVSDSKVMASGSGESYGTIRDTEQYDPNARDIVAQAMQRVAGRLVGDINKAASKAEKTN